MVSPCNCLALGIFFLGSLSSLAASLTSMPDVNPRLCADALVQETSVRSNDQPYFEPHLGSLTEAHPEWQLEHTAEVRLLSDGTENRSSRGNYGHSYVVNPNGAIPYVLKVYNRSWDARCDMDTLSMLRRVLQSDLAEDGFRIVDPTRFNETTLRLSYARGRDLGHLLSDPEISLSLKQHLTELYRMRLEMLARRIKDRIPDIWVEVDPSLKSVNSSGALIPLRMALIPTNPDSSEIRINITPRQVIVDPGSLDMTIVDPY